MSPANVFRTVADYRLYAAVFVIAFLNAFVWSILTPAFQVPDETAHFAYVQRLAERGVRASGQDRPEYSTEQSQVMSALGTLGVIGRIETKTPVTPGASDAAKANIAAAEQDAARTDGGGSSTASSQPPLYYTLATIPYRMTSWFSLTTRLHAIRMMSVLFFALSALACALLAGQIFPSATVLPLLGGLAVGLSPYAAFISSGVNPDSLLLLVASLLALVLGRYAIEGPSRRGVIVAGVLVGCGLMTKLTFLALIPGATLGIAIALLTLRRSEGFPQTCLLTLAGAASLPVVFLLWLRITGQPLIPAFAGTVTLPTNEVTVASFRELVSYAWQLYAPRLPFMTDQFTSDPPINLWLDGFAGRYGWLDYAAPGWIGTWFSRVVLAIAGLALLEAVRHRKAVRSNALSLAVAAIAAGGLMVVIAKAGYDYRRGTGFVFEQPRYLFPLAPFYAVAVAAACHTVGTRLRPALAVAVVALLCLHAYSGWALTLARYYG